MDEKYSPLPPCLLTHTSHVREKKRADRGRVVRSTEGWGQNVVLLNVAGFRMFLFRRDRDHGLVSQNNNSGLFFQIQIT